MKSTVHGDIIPGPQKSTKSGLTPPSTFWIRVAWKRPRYEKYSKIFGDLKNFIFGGIGSPISPTAPKQDFRIFKILVAGFGCVGGAKSPFFENFRKVWKFLKTFHTLVVFIRYVLIEIFGPQICWKWGNLLYFPRFYRFEILKFSENFICGFGCVVGAPSPFFENFRKVWKFLKTFHTLIVFIREVLEKIFRLEISSKVGKNRLWDPKGQNWPKIGDFRVFQRQVPQVDTETYGPKSILPWIESLYKCLSSPGARASMCTHQAH